MSKSDLFLTGMVIGLFLGFMATICLLNVYSNQMLVANGWAHYDTVSGKLVEDKR